MKYKFTFEFDTSRELTRNEQRQLEINLSSEGLKQMKYIPLPYIMYSFNGNVEAISELKGSEQ